MGELQRHISCHEIAQCQSREDGTRSSVINGVECASQGKTVEVLCFSSHTEKPLHILLFIKFMHTVQVPLYRVHEFYEEQDVEGLLCVGRKAADFNRFALGRALDTVYDAGACAIFTGLTLRNLMTTDVPLQFAHGDTTSKVMYGAYDDKDDPDTLKIIEGYSKDKRFDLKQIVMGLVTIGRGMPL